MLNVTIQPYCTIASLLIIKPHSIKLFNFFAVQGRFFVLCTNIAVIQTTVTLKTAFVSINVTTIVKSGNKQVNAD